MELFIVTLSVVDSIWLLIGVSYFVWDIYKERKEKLDARRAIQAREARYFIEEGPYR